MRLLKEYNSIIAHHPIIWGGLKRLTGRNASERVAIKAIKNNIAIYACHTNLDKVHNGVNHKFAEQLELRSKDFRPKKIKKMVTYVPAAELEKVRSAIFEAGAGSIGNYDNCSFESSGNGTFRGNENSNPFVGKKGELSLEKEHRLETIFPVYLQNAIIKALLEAHPYEEVASIFILWIIRFKKQA